MPGNTRHNEPLDRFSAQVKCKLNNHRLPVDMDCWKEIEAHVNRQSRLKKWRIGALTALAAASVALLFILTSPEKRTEKPAYEQVASTPKPAHKEPSAPSPKGNTGAVAAPAYSASANKWDRIVPDTLIAGEEVDITLAALPLPTVKKEHHSGPEPAYRSTQRHTIAIASKVKRSGKWLLAANLGTGGGMPSLLGNGSLLYDNPDYDMSTGNPGIGFPQPPLFDDPSIPLKPESFSDINYAPPLSFGFSVRKNLNKHVGVETGIVYTYLLSKMYKNGHVNYHSKLSLHYLGIPVNIVFYLWNNPKWNIYVSAGGMVEKGLQSVYTQEAYIKGDGTTTSVRSGIDGLQWSLNLSAGVSYKFLPVWSLYLEPRYSYYFDTNQPVSIRTDKPAVIGINAGIRYEF